MPEYLIFEDHGVGVYNDGRTAWSQVGDHVTALNEDKAIEFYLTTRKLDDSDAGLLALAAVPLANLHIDYFRIVPKYEVTPEERG